MRKRRGISRGGVRRRPRLPERVAALRPFYPAGRARRERRRWSEELVFYTNPMSRGRIARWMLEEVGPALPHRRPRLRRGDEGARLPRAQPDGQGADHRARRNGRHRVRRDLRLSRRRLSRGRPRAAAGGARRLLPLAVLRRRPARGGGDQPRPRLRGARRAPADGRLRRLRPGDGRARDARSRAAAMSPATASPPPTSTSARRSAGACASARSRSARPSRPTGTASPTRPAAVRAQEIDDAAMPKQEALRHDRAADRGGARPSSCPRWARPGGARIPDRDAIRKIWKFRELLRGLGLHVPRRARRGEAQPPSRVDERLQRRRRHPDHPRLRRPEPPRHSTSPAASTSSPAPPRSRRTTPSRSSACASSINSARQRG